MLNNVRDHRCAQGIEGTNRTRIAVSNSTVTHHTTALRQTGTDNIMNLDDIFVAYNTTGVSDGADNTVRTSDSVVTQNATGFSHSGTLVSLQGNSVFGNTVDGFAPGTTQNKQ